MPFELITSPAERQVRRPIEVWIGASLLLGVLTSAALLLAGLTWRWIVTGSPQFDYILPRTNVLIFAKQEFSFALNGGVRPRLLVNLGIGVLLLTPYVRVLLSFIYFVFFDRNWKYSVFTGIVLTVLTYSLILR